MVSSKATSKHVPLALLAAGFKSPDEVKAAVNRMHAKCVDEDTAWSRAVDRMLITHSVPLNPQLKPDRNTWRLLALIASMTRDDELGQLAKARLGEAHDFY